MGHTFTNLLAHIVFSTKDRRPWIDGEIQEELCQYMCGIARNKHGAVLKINGTEDHVHVLARLQPRIAPAEFVGAVKGSSSKWVSESHREHEHFQWQPGYSAFSVSESRWETVARYIDRQVEHHRRVTFAEELMKLLERHGVSFDHEHYLD